ncbi:ATP-grasp domain-containing protein [Chryseobacterium taihuense]|uniref:Grasp-with-spasm system ATP-grasp peptide maturase n=1 Tax=Chryseobacterium taihuense TaxID=1141221 RepID=A0ABY0QXI5_9FLAO|nr:hypothetical protein [Chryseobacterium taihuense]SDM08450.1 hypothetical protein SAMN05216273_112101 [Chryseobacterium taihuense]
MIKIITEEFDITSDLIIEWILSLGFEVERKNVESYSDFALEIDNQRINGLFENVFHRRGKLNTLPTNLDNFQYKNEIKSDDNLVLKAFEKIAKKKGNYVGEFNDEEQHNKILDLYLAREVGFDIPDTLITNTKSKLIDFINKNKGEIVTKSIKNPFLIENKNFLAYGRETLLIGLNDITLLEEHFNLGFFQKNIAKIFEVRVFVYKNSLFSMAIFPYSNSNNEVDLRVATDENPKRYVPFALPKIVKKKVKKFLKIKNINTGSIDLMVDSNNIFFFLENNSQGQFHWVSLHCNYNIEKHIALDLIKHEKHL